jgi:hypothetical protein
MDLKKIEQEIINNRSPHWMRCFTVQDKDKQCIAQGVIFHDQLAIVRSAKGQISIYPNYNDYENSLLDQGYWRQVRDVDDWVDVKSANPSNDKGHLEQAMKLMGAHFSY